MRSHVWQLVKFKEVTAIYPPLAELVLRFATSISATVIWLKLLFVAADFLTCSVKSCLLTWQATTLVKYGAWLSLVERLVRDQEAGGSNPLAPTIKFKELRSFPRSVCFFVT